MQYLEYILIDHLSYIKSNVSLTVQRTGIEYRLLMKCVTLPTEAQETLVFLLTPKEHSSLGSDVMINAYQYVQFEHA